MAPSNEAFKNIPYTAVNEFWDPEDAAKTIPLLQYHILQGTFSTMSMEIGPTLVHQTLLTNSVYTNVTSGQNVLVNKQAGDVVIFTTSTGTRCTLEKGDIEFQGGLIQIVDNLLIPPAELGKTSEAFGISSFLGGLYAADLMPNAAERKNVTIFAPQNKAFEEVGGSLEGLDVEALARVLGYHVVPDQILVSSALINGTQLKALSSDTLVIRQAGNNKYVNSAQIVQPDILIANGILHLISNVLNPDAKEIIPDPEKPVQGEVFPVSEVNDVFTSALPCSVDCPVTSTSAGAKGTTTTEMKTRTSEGLGARCTGVIAGAAFGVMGVGAGMALF